MAQTQAQTRLFWIGLCGTLLASRLAHRSVLWADEDYHLAEAIQFLQGKMLYRDVWYDKPPLSALFLALFGGPSGWLLRSLGAGLAIANCAVAFLFARRLWSTREGFFAASLMAFYQVFYVASATIPLEPDTLMLLPHLLAIYWAWSRKPFAAGIASAIAFLLNLKGLFVLAAALAVSPFGLASWLTVSAGFLAPVLTCGGWLVGQGAFPGYVEQVWRWGLLYAGSPPNETALAPVGRLANWLAFHLALLVCIPGAWIRAPRDAASRHLAYRWVAWTVLSVAGASVGWRISPHYLNQLLPPLVIAAAGGLGWFSRRIPMHPENASASQTWMIRSAGAVVAIALIVPIIRFGPRYAILAAEDVAGSKHNWSDVQMDQDSRRAAALITRIAKPGETIVVWGYRPNLVVYTRLPVASRFWDSQPLTGVAADRHLGNATPLDAEWARHNREEFVRSKPDLIVDGLSAYNPQLDIRKFADLADWFKNYCQVAETGKGITVYRQCVR